MQPQTPSWLWYSCCHLLPFCWLLSSRVVELRLDAFRGSNNVMLLSGTSSIYVHFTCLLDQSRTASLVFAGRSLGVKQPLWADVHYNRFPPKSSWPSTTCSTLAPSKKTESGHVYDLLVELWTFPLASHDLLPLFQQFPPKIVILKKLNKNPIRTSWWFQLSTHLVSICLLTTSPAWYRSNPWDFPTPRSGKSSILEPRISREENDSDIKTRLGSIRKSIGDAFLSTTTQTIASSSFNRQTAASAAKLVRHLQSPGDGACNLKFTLTGLKARQLFMRWQAKANMMMVCANVSNNGKGQRQTDIIITITSNLHKYTMSMFQSHCSWDKVLFQWCLPKNIVAILSPSQPTFIQALARAKADPWPVGYAMTLGCNTFPGRILWPLISHTKIKHRQVRAKQSSSILIGFCKIRQWRCVAPPWRGETVKHNEMVHCGATVSLLFVLVCQDSKRRTFHGIEIAAKERWGSARKENTMWVTSIIQNQTTELFDWNIYSLYILHGIHWKCMERWLQSMLVAAAKGRKISGYLRIKQSSNILQSLSIAWYIGSLASGNKYHISLFKTQWYNGMQR